MDATDATDAAIPSDAAQLRAVELAEGVGTLSVTLTGSARAGDVVLVATYTASAVPAVTDSAAATYAQLGVTQGDGTCSLFYGRIGSATAATTITASCGGCQESVVAAEYTDVASGSAFAGLVTVMTGMSTSASAMITTARANDTLVEIIVAAGGTPSPGAGFTGEGGTGQSTLVEDQFVAAPGTFTANANLGGPQYFCAGLLALHASP